MLTYLNTNTITETSLKEIEPILCTNQDTNNNTNNNIFKENDYEEDFNYYNNNYNNNLLKLDYEEENDLINKNGDFFNIGNNLENKMDFLNKKRHIEKYIEEIGENDGDDDVYYNYHENGNTYKHFNIYCNRKNKNKEYSEMQLKETAVDEEILFNQLDEEDNIF